ncbi:MAG: NUDIX domain-containing protein [Pseudomonadales bacterium]|nr:NUDIX domain-containing protein [Anaerolineales bacterium]MCB8917064.1 NUDIX domain-containing protein [Ardenticatenaceae bacterium]MCP5191353.1 NUDIX domain-containing protein [Pseudomonadales bacterium]
MQLLMGLGIRLLVPRHRIGIALVALNEAGQVFMLRHVFHPYAPWGLPGGWMGRGESPEQCILREVWEETGLTAELGPVVHAVYDDRPPHLVLAYSGRLLPGSITLSGEILESAWFAPDALPEPLYDFTRDAIRKAVVVPWPAVPGGD